MPEGSTSPSGTPEGFVAVPIVQGAAGPVRLCVLAQREPDAVGGRLVLLRQTFEAQVFLGCVADAVGRVIEWAELWVQTIEGVQRAPATARDALTNATLDERWARQAGVFAHAGGASVISTGMEMTPGTPTWVDGKSMSAVWAGEGDGGWTLCTKDEALRAAGLPAYSTSLARFLWQEQKKGETGFVAVGAVADADGAKVIKAMESILPEGGKGLTPFNPGGGRMMARVCAPIALEGYLEMLGKAGDAQATVRLGVQHGRTFVDLGKSASGEDAGLFMGRHGTWGRVIETLHLKLRVLADAVSAVRDQVERTQTPLLNVRPESFQVRLDAPARGLPRWWTARTLLADPGEAAALNVPTSDGTYFVPGSPTRATIFSAASAGGALGVGGRGQLRIRQVITDKDGLFILEGTFATQERLSITKNDLVWMRVNLGAAGGRVDLYGRLESEKALAGGEWRVRTLALRLTKEAGSALKAAEGVPLGDVLFETIPLLTSACDLYSLGVLCVRALFVGSGNTLATALDETLSLARAVDEAGGEGALHSRVENVFTGDARWVSGLGPQRLVNPVLKPEEALNLVPLELWCRVLATVIKMFPGVGGESTCRDLGDARQGGLHLVFADAEAGLDDLLRRSRSLIVIDWNANREVHAVIRQFSTGIGGVGMKDNASGRGGR